MNCEAVREHVAEHVLGSLSEGVDGEVRAHLRGCMVCRRERAALEEGVSTLARAAHQVDPPEPLKARVLGVLEEERAEAPQRRRRVPGKPTSWVAAAVIAALAGTLAWTGVVALRASGEAGRYKDFLAALGGRDVRVGTLAPRSHQQVEGSVVMYDSGRGQSWILVLVHAPGETGNAAVTVQSPNRQIRLHTLRFDAGGEGSTWLVTGSDIRNFDRVRVVDASGGLLATGRVSHE